MSTIFVEKAEPSSMAELKRRLKVTWMAGDYDAFSRYMADNAVEFLSRLNVKPGTRLLDVGCGSGKLALAAARAGAKVTACDIASNWLKKARARAASEGLAVTFEEGDAEALPYADAQFDVVVSLIAAMFAPQPELVAAELNRVCRPGGTIAMGNWTPGGFAGKMFKLIASYIAPGGMPDPLLWGEETVVRERLREGISELKCTPRTYRFVYPFPPEKVVEFYRANYGPATRAFAALDAAGQERLREDLVALWSEHNQASDATTRVEAEYLEVIATRSAFSRPEKTDPTERRANASATPARCSPGMRASLLADRIEQGAHTLAAFVAGLSDEEWRTRISESDPRTVGVVVHHVASMYPIEIDAARAIAAGNRLIEVTWEAVAQINAKHSAENRSPEKAASLELLRRNSREAAATVRTFTDDELDRAAPFGLSYGAPVTAQFVIEDHALRHSWHHLARIRKALAK